MSKRKRKRKRDKIGRGAPGNYALNQHAAKFHDRRTRRNRSRSEQERNAIGEGQ